MQNKLVRLVMMLALAFSWVSPGYALDSYRFLHVTIETPWAIFIFLLFTMFVPFILMAALVWRYAERRKEDGKKQADDEGGRE